MAFFAAEKVGWFFVGVLIFWISEIAWDLVLRRMVDVDEVWWSILIYLLFAYMSSLNIINFLCIALWVMFSWFLKILKIIIFENLC